MLNVDRWEVEAWDRVRCHKCKEGIRRDLADLRNAFRANGDSGEDRFYFLVTFDDRSCGAQHQGVVPDDGYFVFVTARDNYASEWQIEWLQNCGEPQDPKFTPELLYFTHDEQ